MGWGKNPIQITRATKNKCEYPNQKCVDTISKTIKNFTKKHREDLSK